MVKTKRKLKLTWQKGSKSRPGRWKKIFQGQALYFDGGAGKSDREAYRKAVQRCEAMIADLSTSTEKPHAEEYEKAISEWEAVCDWCNEHEQEQPWLETGVQKLKDLRRRIAGPRPRPVTRKDRFMDMLLDQSIRSCDLSKDPDPEIARRPGAARRRKNGSRLSKYEKEFKKINVDHIVKRLFKNDSTSRPRGTVEEEIRKLKQFGFNQRLLELSLWQDRLAALQKRNSPRDKSIEGNAERFLDYHLIRVSSGSISVGRYDNIRRGVESFVAHCGGTKLVEAIDEPSIRRYYLYVQKNVSKGRESSSSGKDRLATADQFIRWLWQERILENLPRNLGDHEFTIERGEILVFEQEEIKKLFANAKDRMKLFMLLALNCGMTQKDISDLKQTEVDWRSGSIKRKRSKTVKKKSTPTVTYKLWPETFALIKKFRSKDKDLVLLNKSGKPLKSEALRPDGKMKKTDAIGRGFRRLMAQCELDGRSFGNLKKTSRSLLEDNREFQPIAELFVGRSPKSISEKHYAKPPENWLADATDWLRIELEINRILNNNSCERQ